MHLAGLEMEMMDLDVTLPGTSAASSTRHTHTNRLHQTGMPRR